MAGKQTLGTEAAMGFHNAGKGVMLKNIHCCARRILEHASEYNEYVSLSLAS